MSTLTVGEDGRYRCSQCNCVVDGRQPTTPRCDTPACTNEAVARLLAEGRKQYCVNCLYLMTGHALWRGIDR